MNLQLNDKVYDALKWVALIGMPAVAVLIEGLATAWGWNIPLEAILTTFATIETFIGALIGISTLSYNKEQEEE